ncbi:MAG: SCO family protein [Acidobacteria bacterium]|nr:SCO family protein [Acidobacteriota bacterium]
MVKILSSVGRLGAVALAVAMTAGGASAQKLPNVPTPGEAASTQSNLLKEIQFEQRLDAQVPLDLLFRDETGRAVALKDVFGPRPVILALVYYECPMLCSQVLSGLTSALDVLDFNVGTEFDVVAISFNPKEGPGLAQGKKQSTIERYRRPGTERGWHFLTGPPESIAQLTQAVGFKYAWDETTKQYAHAAGVVVLTPGGKVSKYFYGIEYAPRDLKFGLMQAADGKIGSPAEKLLLYCYHYDPATGTYGLVAMTAVRIAGGLTILGMAAFWFVMWRRSRKAPRLADSLQGV